MRISTALVSALVASGSMALSVQYANTQQQASPNLDLPGLDLAPPADSTLATADPTASAEATTTPSESPAASESQAAPTSTSTPSQTESPSTPTQAPTAEPAPQEVTVTSDAIEYKYGVVQISLTAVGSDITSVTLLQGDTSYGRDVAYTALIDATVKTDGINYGNVSGATFTTDAFKKAVTNALAKR